jgi:hypothetical protein
MDEQDIQSITEAITFWAQTHPDPYSPVLKLGGRSYSPLELAREVRERTPIGALQLRVIQHAVVSQKESLDSILRELTRRATA